MVLHSRQDAQLALHGDAPLVGVLDHLAGQLHVLVKGERGSVDHNGGVPPLNGGDAGVQILAVVQMQGNGNGGVHGVLFHGVGDVQRALFLVLQRPLGEVGAPAHEGVGQIRPLQNGGGTEHLMDLNHRLGLTDRVDVKGSLGIVILLGSIQDRFHWNQ